MDLQPILIRIEEDRDRYLQELVEFLTIPSVSTYSHHADAIQAAAHWLCDHLTRLNLETRLLPTARHPVVYAKSVHSSTAPTLLIYGHYDVQPAEPLEEWKTPPFAPTVANGFLYARGASDDKGQLFTYLKAIEAIQAVRGKLPINIKLLLEGEEEIGSPSLEVFLKQHQQELMADAVVISDGSQFAPGIPAITYGLRGMAYMQIEVQGPRFDLHSGGFGGLVANPVQALTEILAQLKDAHGRVAIPGFYDDVRKLPEWERQEMAALPLDEDALKDYLGVDSLAGEPDYRPVERRGARPTLDINGIWGGFSGEGTKTIIPARAGAKVSMRLVPDQDPERIGHLFTTYLQGLVPTGISLQIRELLGAKPVLVSRDQPWMQAARKAVEIGFGKSPVFVREGGSIPIVTLFQDVLHIENILLLGWGRPDDGTHSPNERFCIDDFWSGIRSAAALLTMMEPD